MRYQPTSIRTLASKCYFSIATPWALCVYVCVLLVVVSRRWWRCQCAQCADNRTEIVRNEGIFGSVLGASG